MIVRRTTDVRCDECLKVCTVEYDQKQDPTYGFVEPYSRLGWAYGPGGSHLCPACFKKALEKNLLHPEPLPPKDASGYRILTVPPQTRRHP